MPLEELRLNIGSCTVTCGALNAFLTQVLPLKQIRFPLKPEDGLAGGFAIGPREAIGA